MVGGDKVTRDKPYNISIHSGSHLKGKGVGDVKFFRITQERKDLKPRLRDLALYKVASCLLKQLRSSQILAPTSCVREKNQEISVQDHITYLSQTRGEHEWRKRGGQVVPDIQISKSQTWAQ